MVDKLLEQAWHTLVMTEGFHVRTEKDMVIRPEAAMRVYAGIHSEYDVKPLNKEYITEEDFMKMYTLKKKNFSLQSLYDRLIELLRSCNPDDYDYEKDFQNDFCELLDKVFIEKSEVRTMPLFGQKEKKKYWSLDIVLKIGKVFIPIELKFRKENQTESGYADDFKEDVQRINALLDKYDDIPLGMAIILTDNLNLLCDCKNKVVELDSPLHPNNELIVENLGSYRAGVVVREKKNPQKKSTNSFSSFWDSKNENN